MTAREALARELLERHGFVTNQMFAQRGMTHTGRNGVSESKPYFKAKGFDIKFKASKNFLENRWTLVPIQTQPVAVDDVGQMAFL